MTNVVNGWLPRHPRARRRRTGREVVGTIEHFLTTTSVHARSGRIILSINATMNEANSCGKVPDALIRSPRETLPPPAEASC